MTRLLGAVLVVASSGMAGFGAVAALERRVRSLEGLVRGLEAMVRELEGHSGDLASMLCAAARSAPGRAGRLFDECRKELLALRQGTFDRIWQRVLEKGDLWLDEGDAEEVAGLGSVLGCYDGESQRAAIDSTVGRLELRLAQARERRAALGKVYGTLGITGGLLLAVLLL